MAYWPCFVACFCLFSTHASHHDVFGKVDTLRMRKRAIPCPSLEESCGKTATRLHERLALMRNVLTDHAVTFKQPEKSGIICIAPHDGTSTTPGFNMDHVEGADCRGAMRLRGGGRGRRARSGGKRRGGYQRRREMYLKILRYERDQEEGKIRAPIIGEDGREEEVMTRIMLHIRM
jgi:hypothetical protein